MNQMDGGYQTKSKNVQSFMYTHTQCEHEMTKSTKCTRAFAIHSLIVINKTELNERMVAGHSLEQYEISDRYIKLK